MRINGKKVVDATKPISFTVTPHDVVRGANKDPAACAAAIACKRVAHAKQVRVHLGRTYVELEDKWVRYQTAKAVRTEVVSFDRSGIFAPGDYQVLPISAAHKIGAGYGSTTNKNRTASKRPRKKIARPYHVVTGVRMHGANR